MLVRINRDPNASDQSGGAAPSAGAQPSAESSVGASAGASPSAEGVNPTQPPPGGSQEKPAPAYNFKEIGARLTRGDMLSDDERDAFMGHLASDDFDKMNKGDDEDEDPNPEIPEVKSDEKPDGEGNKEPDPDADPIVDAMRLTGAKTAAELPGLIKGLRDAMTASGGKLGEQVKNLSETIQTQHNILLGVANGDPQAIADFQRITGKSVPANLSQPNQDPSKANLNPDAQLGEFDSMIKELEAAIMSDEDVANSIDPDAAKRNNAIVKANLRIAKANQADMAKIKFFHQQNEEKQTLARAQDQVFSEMGEIAQKFADDYNKLSLAEIRKHAAVWEKEGIIHPKFEPMVKVLQLAAQKGIPLEDAHKILTYEKKSNATPLIQKSLAEQRNKILNQPVPNSISQNNNGSEAVVTMDMVQNWVKSGQFPEQYMGDNGLDFAKLPKNIQQKLGL